MEDPILPSSFADHEPQLSTELEPAPPRNPQLERPAVKAGDLCVGCIVWLPARSSEKKSIKCCRKDCCNKGDLDDSLYDQPVVVLKIRQRKNSTVRGDLILYIASITTFSDTPLSTYLAKRTKKSPFSNSMLIQHTPTSSSPESRPIILENTPPFLLRLQKGALKKQSYILLSHVYKVPCSNLRTYGFRSCRAYKIRLAPTSYTSLMEEMGLHNESYEDTATLYETAKIRLEALARTSTPREDRIRESHAYFSQPGEDGMLSTPLEREGQSQRDRDRDRSTDRDRERDRSATIERATTPFPPLQARSTMSYISVPGAGGRSRSSSKASIMSRHAALGNLNYGSITINTNVPPTSANSTLPAPQPSAGLFSEFSSLSSKGHKRNFSTESCGAAIQANKLVPAPGNANKDADVERGLSLPISSLPTVTAIGERERERGERDALSPLPYYLPPPTPHTAHYHSFKEFQDDDWRWFVGKVVAGILALSGVIYWCAMWGWGWGF